MRAGALRWTLRQWSRPYEAQQARNLYHARKCDKVTRSAQRETLGCYRCVDNPMRKERARLVPAAAVKPALQVVGIFIGLKVSVAG